MHRGFTLLELLITVAVLITLLLFAAPNFSQISQQSKMVNLANELQGFLIQAKSEAVLRNQNLWVHMQGLPSASGDWTLRLASVEAAADITEHNTLAVLQGARYRNVYLSSTFNHPSLKFDHVMGNPKSAGSIELKQTESDANPIKVVVSNGAGRIRVCADNEVKYGFEKC
ncbi:MAG: GspH/FimT family pseudopilin [Vibrio sp.]